MELIIDTPWRLTSHFYRLLAWPYIRLMFRLHGITWGHGWRIFGMPIIQRHRRSVIELGSPIEARCGVVTDCDITAVADGILSLLQNPKEAHEMGRRGRALVENKFTWTAVARSMLTAYQTILKNQGA